MLAAFRAEVLDLRKYAVLNSTAVIKAVKKRNRHLRAAVGPTLHPLRATDLLSQQYFFTSSKLAALSTQAEVLSKVCGSFLYKITVYESLAAGTSCTDRCWGLGHASQPACCLASSPCPMMDSGHQAIMAGSSAQMLVS